LLADTLALCGERLLILKTSKGVPKNVAEFFIEHCAWWDHPSVGWTRAPKYSQRIEWGNYGWEVRFGGNIFLVGLAIERCVEMVQNLLDLAGRGKRYYSYLELEKLLKLRVSGAVADNEGCEYHGYYPVDANSRMLFGTLCVDVNEFVGIMINAVGIKKIYLSSIERSPARTYEQKWERFLGSKEAIVETYKERWERFLNAESKARRTR
jgi:hypothetical protein